MTKEQGDSKSDDADGQQNRMAIGIALGVPIGVALSLILDNWGMLGVGVALGVSFGLLPSSKDRATEDAGLTEDDREP